MKKAWIVLFTLCLCAALLAGCGGAPAGEDLAEYVVEGVGTCYLPEGFELNVSYLEQPFPHYEALLTKGDLTVAFARTGADGYEVAGVPLPADVEEFSQRSGPQSALPEGVDYAWDEYGNMAVGFPTDDGYAYEVLLQGTEAFGNFNLFCPEGDPAIESFPQWASLAKLN